MYEDVVRSLGAVFDNRTLYGAAHQVTIQSLEQAFELLTQTLSTEDTLLLAVNPDDFLINHQAVEMKNPLMQRFVDILRAHEISTLTISKSLTADEFLTLVDTIAKPPEELASSGGMSAALQDPAFTHVQSRKVTYVELTEDETVVKKDEIGDGASRGARDEAVMDYLGVYESDEEPAAPDTSPHAASESASAPAPAANVAEGLQELMTCPAEFGELLIHSVGASMDLDLAGELPVATPSATSQLLIDRIVKCLERAFAVLKEDRSTRSQKGKKALIKSLQTLEKDLDSVIREAIKPVDDEALAPISSAIESMTDELAVDALAAEYLRKRKLIEDSEKRVLRYMNRHGTEIDDSELKAKLLDGGLPESNWDMLMQTSGVRSATSELMSGIPGFQHLREMLGQLADCFQSVDPDDPGARERLKRLIGQVEERLEQLVENTRQRMAHLSGKVSESEPKGAANEAARRQSRGKLLALIAEIVQELCQPLSVIQCALDVICSQDVASLTPERQDILKLAAKSTRRLTILIRELHDIVGPPADLVPRELTKDSFA